MVPPIWLHGTPSVTIKWGPEIFLSIFYTISRIIRALTDPPLITMPPWNFFKYSPGSLLLAPKRWFHGTPSFIGNRAPNY